MAVRQAAVYSLGKLAANRPEFAKKCIDHLADMFNDEIQQVRLDAIRALSPLVIHGTIQQDQLHTILTGLDDANAENRTAIHELLSKSNLADADCVKQCIRVLLHSLKRFPIDKFSIYECLSAIGLHHSVFVHGLVTEMLEIHPIFDTPEQHIDDDFYLGKLILVLNAASNHSVICSLIPAYVKKHYRYLRCAAPKLIPVVKEIEESKVRAKMFDFSTLADSKVDYLLRSTYERISEANSKELIDRVILLDMILKDLHAYQNIEQEIAIPAGFLHRFCRVVKLYNVAMSSSLSTNSTEPVFISYAECMEDIFWIENQYSGTNKSVLAFLAECSFKLLVLVVAMTLDASNYQQFVTTIRDGLLKANRRLIELDVSSSESMSNLVTWIALNLPGVEDKVKMEPIKMEVQSVLILRQKLLSLLKGCYEIGEVVRFVSGLPTGILLTCHLSNLTATDLENFRIEIKYPDTTLAYFRPRPTDIHRLSEQMVRVQTSVIVSACTWSSVGTIQLSCGLLSPKQNSKSMTASKMQCFVPLADADFRCFVNKIAVKIHPNQRTKSSSSHYFIGQLKSPLWEARVAAADAIGIVFSNALKETNAENELRQRTSNYASQLGNLNLTFVLKHYRPLLSFKVTPALSVQTLNISKREQRKIIDVHLDLNSQPSASSSNQSLSEDSKEELQSNFSKSDFDQIIQNTELEGILQAFLEYLLSGLINQHWETRHGAAMALTKLISSTDLTICDRQQRCGTLLHHIKVLLHTCSEELWQCRQTALLFAKYYFSVCSHSDDFLLFFQAVNEAVSDPVDEVVSKAVVALSALFSNPNLIN
uniref:Integrator complex subunit 4 n=1 Tax=Ditylenchus dipsaci TaxID=166011 RepID=A0A915DUA8_9BILA